MEYIIRRVRPPDSLIRDVVDAATDTATNTDTDTDTMKLPVLSPRLPDPLPKPVSKNKRQYMGPIITTTALSVVCLGVAVGLPMMRSLHKQDGDLTALPPGNTQTHEPTPSLLPTIPTFPSQNPVEQLPSKTTRPALPTPIYAASVCETQVGTVEGQLPFGEPVLPATSDRPSIFVVSPDRSAQQSFTVRLAGDRSAAWNTVYQAGNVGIVGIALADTQFQTTDGQKTVWGKSCEPSRDVVDEVASRIDDLCNRRDLGLKAVVVYNVGIDGKPVEMNSTNC